MTKEELIEKYTELIWQAKLNPGRIFNLEYSLIVKFITCVYLLEELELYEVLLGMVAEKFGDGIYMDVQMEIISINS